MMDKNKATIWFFGDSYTRGISQSKIYDLVKSKNKRYRPWPDILSEQHKFNKINLAMGGNSNDGIINSILENLNEMKHGDVVIVSDTSPLRILGINPNKNDELKYITLNNYIQDGKVFTDSGLDSTQSKYLTNYIYDFYYKYEDVWSRAFYERIVHLRRYLEQEGVQVFFWSYKLWNDESNKVRFSRIVDESDGTILDSHWGIEGNIQFCQFMSKNLENKIYDIFY